jgi:hypothetical protein
MNAQAPLREITMEMRIKLMNMALADGNDTARNEKNAKFVLRRNGYEGPKTESRGAATRCA